MDCGPTCLHMVAKYYGKTYSLQALRQKSHITLEGLSEAKSLKKNNHCVWYSNSQFVHVFFIWEFRGLGRLLMIKRLVDLTIFNSLCFT